RTAMIHYVFAYHFRPQGENDMQKLRNPSQRITKNVPTNPPSTSRRDEGMSMQPTEDERVLAALSHASIVANIVNLAGMIATALIWTTQRERSRYVGAHALQSLVYQGSVLLIGIFLTILWGLCLVLSLLPAVLRPDL